MKRGQLARLDAEHERHLGVEPRVLPCRFQRYSGEARSPAAAEIPEPNLGSDWIVLGRSGGPRLPVVRCVDVARSLRGALLAHAEEPIPSVLTGHGPDGGAAESPHAAFVALPFVAHRHADGSLLGVALVLPRDTPPADRKAVLRALGRFEAAHRLEDEEAPGVPLLLGDAGVLEVRRVAPGASTPGTLDPETWCRPATRWLSATPVALDRNPGDLRDADPDRQAAAFQAAEESIRMACVRAGLPAPVRVTIVPSVPWPGAAKARQHPPFPADGPRFQRVKVHAALEFAGPVAGPLLVGAGRYFGLGLFRPCPEGGSRP